MFFQHNQISIMIRRLRKLSDLMKDWMNWGTSYIQNSESAMNYHKTYSRDKIIADMRHLYTLHQFNNLIRDVAYRPEECFNSRHSPC